MSHIEPENPLRFLPLGTPLRREPSASAMFQSLDTLALQSDGLERAALREARGRVSEILCYGGLITSNGGCQIDMSFELSNHLELKRMVKMSQQRLRRICTQIKIDYPLPEYPQGTAIHFIPPEYIETLRITDNSCVVSENPHDVEHENEQPLDELVEGVGNMVKQLYEYIGLETSTYPFPIIAQTILIDIVKEYTNS